MADKGSRAKYILADQATAIAEATKQMEIYRTESTKTTKTAKANAEKAAKEVFKWANAYQAHGGNKSDLDKNLLDIASIGKSNIKTADSKGYNYSVAKFEESIKLMQEAASNGIDLSSIATQFGMAEDKAKELASSFGQIQHGAKDAMSGVADATKSATKHMESSLDKLSELRNKIASLFDDKKVWVTPGRTNQAATEDYEEFKKLVDEYVKLGGKLDDIQVRAGQKSLSPGERISRRYESLTGITEGVQV